MKPRLLTWMDEHCVISSIAIVVLYSVGLVTLVYKLGEAGCLARWDGVYPVQFNLPGGCKINKEGKWLPESVIRVVE